jgi:hypothetical protein
MQFCKQCSLELFGKDLRELAGDGKRIANCAGCGTIMVDEDGACMSDCTKAHCAPYLRLLMRHVRQDAAILQVLLLLLILLMVTIGTVR